MSGDAGVISAETDRKNGSPAKALVSVVIPTYRRPALLCRAVASALRQTYNALEIIVVDDAADAATPAALAGVVADQRVRCIANQRTQGAPGARNTGILEARGDYIALLDDDDEWREDKIERQFRAMDAWDGVVCGSTSRSSRERRLPSGLIDRKLLRRGYFLEGGSSAMLVRADVLKANLFDESLSRWQDWDLLIRLTERWRIGYIDEPLVIYNEGAHPRITNRPKSLSFEELEHRLSMVEKHKEFLGTCWANRHFAGGLLAYVRYRDDKLQHIWRTVLRAGVSSVIAVAFARVAGRFRWEGRT